MKREKISKNIKQKLRSKSKNNIFYKTSLRGGISLIVLVITIIVVIILAAAVIVSIVNNNPMIEASEARIKSDVANMQAIFTNAVGKVMAENQEVIEIEPNQLNTVTSGDKSAEGTAIYRFGDGSSGQIIFKDEVNEGRNYYTGRKLPLYNKETKWYVDEDGILALEIGKKKYGEGKITKNIKITTEVIPSEEYIKNKVTVKVEISSEDEIVSIKFGGKDVEVPELVDGKYVLEIEVTENGTYEVEVSSKNGTTNKVTVEVKEIEKINTNIQIKPTVTTTSDYVKGNMNLEITSNVDIESIKINGESVAVPNKTGGKYILDKEVLENGEYKVEVKGKDGTINKTIVKVTDITEDMEIWNRADMESFRNKVNTGRTFEGRTVKVMADIDLQGDESNQWIPIGMGSFDESWNFKDINVFKGTFEGNYHKIQNLYINNNYEIQGLFQYNLGNIYRIQIVSGSITGGEYVGAIAGYNNGGKIVECGNKINITAQGEQGAGGIVGKNAVLSTISSCYNTGRIKVLGSYNVGGIAGDNMGTIEYSYNSGIVGDNNVAHSGGIAGASFTTTTETRTSIKNSFNVGTVLGWQDVGGITGINGEANSFYGGTIEKCYYLSSSCGTGIGESFSSIKDEATPKSETELKAFTLSNIFVKDTVNKNAGYPILKWQLTN